MPLDPIHPNHGCVKPFLTTNPITINDLPHGYQSSVAAYDNGKMDGFMVAENENNDTMSYYNNYTIPYYWDFAKHYVLADNFFSSILSYSLPNHWYAIAGQAPTTSIYYGMQKSINLANVNNKLIPNSTSNINSGLDPNGNNPNVIPYLNKNDIAINNVMVQTDPTHFNPNIHQMKKDYIK